MTKHAKLSGTFLCGTALLAATLAATVGTAAFYAFGMASALTWIGGSLLCGGVPWLDRRKGPASRQAALATLLGSGYFAAFVAIRLVAEHLTLLGPSIDTVLERADAGPRAFVLAVALVNGIGEEMFFRGVLYDALARYRPVLATTAIYAAATAATLQPALIAAAIALGGAFSVQRRRSGGVLAPVVTHLSWSTLVLFLLPR